MRRRFHIQMIIENVNPIVRNFLTFGVISIASTMTFAQNVPNVNTSISVNDVLYPGEQYTATHVYTTPDKIDALAMSLQATFGSTGGFSLDNYQITPTPSSAKATVLTTPVGSFSLFAFHSPVPFAFGEDRIGYYVKDIDAAVKKALQSGASVVVSKFTDPIGSDAIVRWPGGRVTQLYHTNDPRSDAPLITIPEQRVYVSSDNATAYILGYLQFTGGQIIKVLSAADGRDIGQPGKTYQRFYLKSSVGVVDVLVTNGQLPFPYGKEHDGFQVPDVVAAVQRAVTSGATALTDAIYANGRTSAIIEFPGGFVAEVHDKGVF